MVDETVKDMFNIHMRVFYLFKINKHVLSESIFPPTSSEAVLADCHRQLIASSIWLGSVQTTEPWQQARTLKPGGTDDSVIKSLH